jgi:hypothetical protein
MIFSSLFRLAGSALLASNLLGKLGGCLLGGAALLWVAAHVGPQTGTVTIHVAEPDVVVSVGDLTFRVEDDLFTPLVCDLPPGQHRLTMQRGATVLYAETFSIGGGEDRVLGAGRPRAR